MAAYTCGKSSWPDWGHLEGKNHVKVTSESSINLSEPQPASPAPRHSTFGHELRDDINGLLCDHGMQLHQLVMLQSFHQVGLCQEGLHRHAPWLHGLHGHLGVLVVGGWSGRESRKDGQNPCSFPIVQEGPAAELPPPQSLPCPTQPLEKDGLWLRQMWVAKLVHAFLAVCPWASHLSSLICGFLICEVGMISTAFEGLL